MYPINLILDNKNCLVIGGGHVALRKVEGLLDSGVSITIISPELVPELHKLVEQAKVTWINKCYQPDDIADYQIAICAVGNDTVNQQVYADAHKYRVLLNTVDNLKFCDFALPAKIRRGDLLVTFSTNGKSPALSRYLRAHMETFFDDSYALWLERLTQLRQEAIKQLPTAEHREVFWRSALSDEIMELVRQKNYDEAEAAIRNAISSFRA